MSQSKRRHFLPQLTLALIMFLSVLLVGIALADETIVPPPKITSFEYEWDAYAERVIINTTGWVQPEEFYTFNPHQIILDFNDATYASDIVSAFSRSKDITEVKLIENPEEPGKPRVVIKLKEDMEFEVINVFGKNKTIVEIAKPAEKIEVKLETPTPKKTSLTGKIIFVDAGHGGTETGAISLTGKEEKVLTLDTAKRLETILTKLGAKVIMSRETDVTLEKPNIVKNVEDSRADIYVGIHYNSFRMHEIRGTETYFYNKPSSRLARMVHFGMLTGLSQPDRGVHRKMLYTVHHTDVPAVILEPAYLTNRTDNRKIESARFRDQVAWSIARALNGYFKH